MKYLLLVIFLVLTVYGCSGITPTDDHSAMEREARDICYIETSYFIKKFDTCGIDVDNHLQYKECYLYGSYELTDDEMDKVNDCLISINNLTCEELPDYDQKMNTLESCIEFSEKARITKKEVCMNNVTSFCLNLYSVCRDKTKSEFCEPAYFTDNDPKTEERVDVDSSKLAWYCEGYSTEPATEEDFITNCSTIMTCEQFGEMNYDFENLDSYCESLQ